ncbi:probable leucine-rich repeat receptor-like protein kinase IMK3 [Tanacetum coccineum]
MESYRMPVGLIELSTRIANGHSVCPECKHIVLLFALNLVPKSLSLVCFFLIRVSLFCGGMDIDQWEAPVTKSNHLLNFDIARGPNTPVNWPTRMRIAKGMTRGLLNLHTHQNIIHGNLTSNNVLLDDDLNPKIADFGLSQLMTTAANSNVIATAGALGYRAPELSKLKKANTKTDIYSLGVIMLELLTGKSPGEAEDGVDLPQWVDELLNTLKLALHCVDPSPSARPEAQLVLQQLEEIRLETPTSLGDDGVGSGPSRE